MATIINGTTGIDKIQDGTANTDTTSSSFVATDFEVTITPSSTSSKILITVNGHYYTPANEQCAFDIYRDNTTSITGETHGLGNFWYESTRGRFPFSVAKIDSPSTTNATTYTLYIKKTTGSNNTSIPNNLSSKNTITAMEISG